MDNKVSFSLTRGLFTCVGGLATTVVRVGLVRIKLKARPYTTARVVRSVARGKPPRLPRREIERIVEEELDEEIIRDIGREGVEATVAGLELLDTMLAYNCSDEAFETALDLLEEVAEGRAERGAVNCDDTRIVIERTQDGKIHITAVDRME